MVDTLVYLQYFLTSWWEIVNCYAGEKACIILDLNSACDPSSLQNTIESDGTVHNDKYPLFERFCHSGLCRLGLEPLPDMRLRDIWNDIEPFSVSYNAEIVPTDFRMLFSQKSA